MDRFCMAVVAALTATSAEAATVIPVPNVPGASYTFVFDINDKNVIAGAYISGDGEHAFFGSLQGDYTTFDFTPTGGTEARAIDNAGRITGISHFLGGSYCKYLEFERKPDGTITAIQHGQHTLHGIVQGFTARGKFVGDYCQHDTVNGYDGNNAKYREPVAIAVSTSATYVRDINISGDIVGGFINSSGTNSSFLLRNGVTSVIEYPNLKAANTFLQGLNDSGIATGHWDKGDYLWHAFMLDTNTDAFTTIAVPGASYVEAFGINKSGLVAVDASNGPYIYCPSGAACPAGGMEATVHRTRVSPGSFLRFDASRKGRHAARGVTPRPRQVNGDGIF